MLEAPWGRQVGSENGTIHDHSEDLFRFAYWAHGHVDLVLSGHISTSDFLASLAQSIASLDVLQVFRGQNMSGADYSGQSSFFEIIAKDHPDLGP